MIAQFLKSIPISGSVTECHYEAFGSCSWVQFTLPDGEEWVGVFGNGDNGSYGSVTLFDLGKSALVTAGGKSYVIDTSLRDLIYQPNIEALFDAIAIPNRDFVVCCDYTGLFALNSSGINWQSDQVALDGIIFTSATDQTLTGKVLTGKVWNIDGWYWFTLTFENWKYTQGEATGEK